MPAEEGGSLDDIDVDEEEVPGLDALLGKLDQEQVEDDSRRQLALDQDGIDEEAASYSVDQLLLRANADVARAVALFGPGIVALPMFGHISGVDGVRSLAYDKLPTRQAGGVLDRLDVETKFGSIDPQTLMEELQGGESWVQRRLKGMKSEDIRKDITMLQEWRRKAQGRLRTLTRRAAWAVLGIPYTKDEVVIRRAFKRKALELHPDKGGDAQRFQLLQELRDSLILKNVQKAVEEEIDEEKEEEEEEEEQGAAGGLGMQAKDPSKAAPSEEDLDELEKLFQRASRGEQEDMHAEELREAAKSPDRAELEAARLKIHLSLVDAWCRSGQLASELQSLESCKPGSSGPVRALRRFVDRFTAMEFRQLEDGDARKAERIFRRFLEQGSEVLCAAATLDPEAAVAEIAGKVNAHLLAAANGKEELAKRCARLLEALRDLPGMPERFLLQVQLPEKEARNTAKEEGPVARSSPTTLAAETQDVTKDYLKKTCGLADDKAFLEGLFASVAKAAEAAVDGAKRPTQQDKKAEEAQQRLRDERKKEEEARRAAAEARRKAQEERERHEEEAEEDERSVKPQVQSTALVVGSAEVEGSKAVQKLRTEWDPCWEHPCAGDKKHDGTAIFCLPSNSWVVVPPFDHTAFELHCERAGYTDWID